jgi:hypothetical protein
MLPDEALAGEQLRVGLERGARCSDELHPELGGDPVELGDDTAACRAAHEIAAVDRPRGIEPVGDIGRERRVHGA